ncbi:hypothetical protein K5X82_13375 [Halosquirtibacter xylanolyticus]|uniref:hypothetical protein n=1 Tax=Halosquirtibacter xylanolyticus TaxID=3374599 RepID=UPI0037496E63|nr:hypothetical protein K5X82_13375 [Prolixibacteraceae bacterium]
MDNLELHGNLFKRESLNRVVEDIVPDTLVFEVINPFYGYYGDKSKANTPLYFYIMFTKNYPLSCVEHTIEMMKVAQLINLDAVKVVLNISGKEHYGIRLRGVEGHGKILELQECFVRYGYELSRNEYRDVTFEANVEIDKFFELSEVSDNMFFDNTENNHAYFILPSFLKWKEFERLDRQAHLNWEGLNFDSALCALRFNGVYRSAIRIYRKSLTPEFVDEIKRSYERKLMFMQ